MISCVAAGLQLLKVNGEVMYFALKQKEHAARVFWQLLSARRFVKEAPIVLLTAHSGVELLAGQHASSGDWLPKHCMTCYLLLYQLLVMTVVIAYRVCIV